MPAPRAGLGPPGRCRLCNRPLPTGTRDDVCDAPLCRTRIRVETDLALSSDMRARKEAARQLRLTRARSLLESLADRLDHADAESVPRTITPMVDLPLEPCDPEEIARFMAHVDRLLDEAFTDPDEPPAEPVDAEERAAAMADAPLALNATCILCQGDCCTLGRYRLAYLDARDIAAFRHARPDWSRDQIREAYRGQIPELSIKNSCLFHGDRGCALPRDMRSLLCNSWQCRSRAELGRQIEKDGKIRSVVVALAEDHDAHPERGAPVLRAATVSERQGLEFHDDLVLPPLPDPRTRG